MNNGGEQKIIYNTIRIESLASNSQYSAIDQWGLWEEWTLTSMESCIYDPPVLLIQ